MAYTSSDSWLMLWRKAQASFHTGYAWVALLFNETAPPVACKVSRGGAGVKEGRARRAEEGLYPSSVDNSR